MQATAYPDINGMLEDLLARIQAILGQKLVGVYLYGSLVWGDFDPDISDIDLLVVIASELDDGEFSALDRMHLDVVGKRMRGEDRLEIAYVPVAALRTFKARASTIAIISPGEPFHLKEAGVDWLINWYTVQEQSVTLFGPAPTTLIDPISKEEYLRAVRRQVQDWGEWVYHGRDRPWQAYTILTMCRALYAVTHGRQASKRQAALWAQQELPQWSPLIGDALAWRAAWRDDVADPEATFPETVRFVQFIIGQVTGQPAMKSQNRRERR
jgi:predicted nucleotidyltransferase